MKELIFLNYSSKIDFINSPCFFFKFYVHSFFVVCDIKKNSPKDSQSFDRILSRTIFKIEDSFCDTIKALTSDITCLW